MMDGWMAGLVGLATSRLASSTSHTSSLHLGGHLSVCVSVSWGGAKRVCAAAFFLVSYGLDLVLNFLRYARRCDCVVNCLFCNSAATKGYDGLELEIWIWVGYLINLLEAREGIFWWVGFMSRRDWME
ncbi:hypothetical protein P154DRAFT_271393 [Amniculicola lignicola CBS 123094]|uniref:Uncharacterized protein n=1 Tax=Amniculicola lignicola CBS 123094 TaxID=1392246 RepID=A0A6A5WFL4_9PLEO|nr:hypothetical protein P154DRAFT_271393 [Amniculicola lignicola CBS 123094]